MDNAHEAHLSTNGLQRIRIGDQEFTILFPGLLRPLTKSEENGLRDDIEERGVVVSIVVDERGGVIDGGNRLAIAAELGLDRVPTDITPGLSLDEKRALALALNEHRRHLTPEDRKELAVQLRQQGKSTREIAERLDTNQTNVVRDLAGEPNGSPGPVTGKDGKQHGVIRLRPPSHSFTMLLRPCRRSTRAAGCTAAHSRTPPG